MEPAMRIEAPASFLAAVGSVVKDKILAPGSLPNGIMTANRKNMGSDPEKTREGILDRVRDNTATAVERFHQAAKRLSRT